MGSICISLALFLSASLRINDTILTIGAFWLSAVTSLTSSLSSSTNSTSPLSTSLITFAISSSAVPKTFSKASLISFSEAITISICASRTTAFISSIARISVGSDIATVILSPNLDIGTRLCLCDIFSGSNLTIFGSILYFDRSIGGIPSSPLKKTIKSLPVMIFSFIRIFPMLSPPFLRRERMRLSLSLSISFFSCKTSSNLSEIVFPAILFIHHYILVSHGHSYDLLYGRLSP